MEERLLLEVLSIARELHRSGLLSYKELRSVKTRLKPATAVSVLRRRTSKREAVAAMQQRRFQAVARVVERSVPANATFGRFREGR